MAKYLLVIKKYIIYGLKIKTSYYLFYTYIRIRGSTYSLGSGDTNTAIPLLDMKFSCSCILDIKLHIFNYILFKLIYNIEAASE